MEKRLWIKIKRIKFHSFEKFSWNILTGPGAGKTTEHNDASFSLRLGDFLDISGIEIELDSQRGIVSHNDAMTEVRLIDIPFIHRGKRISKYLLSDVLSREINTFLNETNCKKVTSFLKKRGISLKDSEFFQPKDWKHPLRIPVEFIGLNGFNARGKGTVLTNIMIGHHILLFNVQVFPRFDSGGTILDEKIIKMINNILEKEDVKKMLDYTKEVSFWYSTKKIIDSIPGCNLEKIPPIRFY
ncbi:MAG: hypothetical protein WC998_05415 [Candidatus Paceibacterota bacterium]|jgi:hypothetical protein